MQLKPDQREQLGPFQAIWNAWNAADNEIKQKPLRHFQRATEVQFEELADHLDRGKRDAAAREAIDVISIALNCLRWLEYQPEEVAELARARAKHRMDGQTAQILDKYEDLHGI